MMISVSVLTLCCYRVSVVNHVFLDHFSFCCIKWLVPEISNSGSFYLDERENEDTLVLVHSALSF